MKPIEPIKEHLKKPFKAKKCDKYDLQGRLLGVYHSVKEAAKENDIKHNFLLYMFNHFDGIHKGGKDLIWKSFRESEIVPKIIRL